jgi:DNA-binding transcriptional regulator of glucitol operon
VQWNRLFLLLAAAWLVQVWMTGRQVQAYQKTVREMARRPGGFLGVGTFRKWMRRGAVVILVTDPAGWIQEGKALYGLTVFSRPRPYQEWNGWALAEAMETASSRKPRTALLEASISALEQIHAQRERARAAQAEPQGAE